MLFLARWGRRKKEKSQGKICRVEKCSVKGPAVDWNDLRFRPLFTRRVQRPVEIHPSHIVPVLSDRLRQ